MLGNSGNSWYVVNVKRRSVDSKSDYYRKVLQFTQRVESGIHEGQGAFDHMLQYYQVFSIFVMIDFLQVHLEMKGSERIGQK